MGFWKKNEITKLNSDEFETISKRITLLSANVDIVENKCGLLLSSIRKLNMRVAVISKETTKEESENDLKDDKLHI